MSPAKKPTVKSTAKESSKETKITLPAALFDAKVSSQILAQAVRVHLANQRKARAKTKTRTEVAKTTAKMYRQKGTGRARHGSYSAPVFVGGGIAHGPSGEQNYSRRLPAQFRKLALAGALTAKAHAKAVKIIDDADRATGKTKDAVKTLTGEKSLVVVMREQDKAVRGYRNIKGVSVVYYDQLNPFLVLANKKIVITSQALEALKKRYAA